MADPLDYPSYTPSGTLQGPLNSHPPDPPPNSPPAASTNDPPFSPISRHNTTTASEASSSKQDICRICRCEATPSEPLFYPCKCAGSMRYVHQECLMEWLSHSHKKHCELCKTAFRFTKLYDAGMPRKLPWGVFVRRGMVHLGVSTVQGLRGGLVAAVWMVMLPWIIRWVWRWVFWVADAGWARDAFVRRSRSEDLATILGQTNGTSHWTDMFQDAAAPEHVNINGSTAEPAALSITRNFLASMTRLINSNSSSIHQDTTSYHPLTALQPSPDASLFAHWTYISQLTPNPHLNRIILDIFEGQLITSLVIIAFILIFLIREWVVQQQPHVHVHHVDFDAVEQQLREAAEMVAEHDARLRLQGEVLELARQSLVELERDSLGGSFGGGEDNDAMGVEFLGLEVLEERIDSAMEYLRGQDVEETERFLEGARSVVEQFRVARAAGVDFDEVADRVLAKLTGCSEEERRRWLVVLVSEIERLRGGREEKAGATVREQKDDDVTVKQARADGSPSMQANEQAESAGPSRRPEMPERDFSSRATHIRRLLEEAEAGNVRVRSAGEGYANGEQTPAAHGSGPVAISASSDGSQPVSPPDEQAEDLGDEPLPIINAGPDAKLHIRRSGRGKLRAVPEPEEEEEKPDGDKKSKRQTSRTDTSQVTNVREAAETDSTLSEARTAGSATEPGSDHVGNPFHPDGPEPTEPYEDTLGNRVASAFREEFGLVEADGLEQFQQPGRGLEGEDLTDQDDDDDDEPSDVLPQPLEEAHDRSSLQHLANWFWGDIQPPNVSEAIPAANEERAVAGNAAQEAPFVPIQNGEPIPAHDQPLQPDAQLEEEAEAPHQDPEVLIAAQQAGLDAEAVEDAEDLEGIFELVGLQGPLIGLFQTSTFCTALVSSTVVGAVGLPYLWGKLVLSFMGSQMYFLVQLPLRLASAGADFVVDGVAFAGSAVVVGFGFLVKAMGLALRGVLPMQSVVALMEKLMAVAGGILRASGTRLQGLFLVANSPGGLSWDGSLLRASVHSHASLRTLEGEVDAVLDYFRKALWSVLDTLSTGSASLIWQRSVETVSQMTDAQSRLLAAVKALQQRAQLALTAVAGLKIGGLTITVSSPQAPLDPSLVYWDPIDRALAVLTGYIALALLAAIYVAADTPITRSPSGQKTEKLVRDTLRQAGGVLKVILIISIEMLVFPLYCGMLIDIAFLPLFEGASMNTRLAFAAESPYLFCFMHWFLGTCYMFHFALFVGMCRKILRKGVLWFIRDPDDPTFHPVRDVLERNVGTQLRKIAFSALVYGGLVILCLGGVIWSIGHVFEGIFPIHWISTEPVLEFPVDLLLYNFLTPVVIRLFKPSDVVQAMYGWWLRHCARGLRLSHFLFGDRRKDEEGRFMHNTRASLIEGAGAPKDQNNAADDEIPEVRLVRDGKFVLTPCNDQYRPPKAGEAFLHTTEDDIYVADQDGKKSEQFAKIFIPPHFRTRLTLFMVCLWIFSAFIGLCATLIPLAFGRQVFYLVLPQLRVNDIYAYSVGAYVLGALLFVGLKGGAGLKYLRARSPTVNLKAWIEPAKRYVLQVLKCVYVYGFLAVALPIMFAVLLQFYLILPLHTYAISLADSTPLDSQIKLVANATDSAASPLLQQATGQNASSATSPNLAQHSIHLLQDYALGILYIRIATKTIFSTPTSRAAEAFRRVIALGYLNLDVRLATRFFVLPATLIAAFLLLSPPLAVWFATNMVQFAGYGTYFSEEMATKAYRYSYPAAAVLGMAVLSGLEVGKATSRWRARIRDEVYLVGERLHNFGEKRPPVGSKSVIRKEK